MAVWTSLFGKVRRAFPEDGAVRGGYFDVAETSRGIIAAEKEISFPNEIVLASEQQVIIEHDTNVLPP